MSKILVAYFSASGVTKKVAEKLAALVNADIHEIKPKVPYTKADLNWMDKRSRSSVEMNDPKSRPAMAETPRLAGYDTVFVGYPIWWGGSAWPVNGFVKANDFTGKTVIPFCTSASSALGQSGETLAQLAGTGDWQEGQRFGSSAARSDVADWLTGLGFTVR